LLRCNFAARLLLSIQYDIVDQADVAEERRDDDQCLVIPNLFNGLQRLAIDDRNIIDPCRRLGRDRLLDDLDEPQRISFALLKSDLSVAERMKDDRGLLSVVIAQQSVPRRHGEPRLFADRRQYDDLGFKPQVTRQSFYDRDLLSILLPEISAGGTNRI